MSGYCAIGKVGSEIAPASSNSADRTDAKIGRVMKNLVNNERRLVHPRDQYDELCLGLPGCDFAPPLLAGAPAPGGPPPPGGKACTGEPGCNVTE